MEAITQDVQVGSSLDAKIEYAKPAPAAETHDVSAQISAATFSTFFTWRGSGSVKLNCGDGRINANSRVFASVSEYNTDPRQNRFVGNASMSVFNVSPYNGGVIVWFTVNWNGPLNIRIDVLVDPSAI